MCKSVSQFVGVGVGGRQGQGSFEHCSIALSPPPPQPCVDATVCARFWHCSSRIWLPLRAALMINHLHPSQLWERPSKPSPPRGETEGQRDASVETEREKRERREGCYVRKSFELLVSWLHDEQMERDRWHVRTEVEGEDENMFQARELRAKRKKMTIWEGIEIQNVDAVEQGCDQWSEAGRWLWWTTVCLQQSAYVSMWMWVQSIKVCLDTVMQAEHAQTEGPA